MWVLGVISGWGLCSSSTYTATSEELSMWDEPKAGVSLTAVKPAGAGSPYQQPWEVVAESSVSQCPSSELLALQRLSGGGGGEGTRLPLWSGELTPWFVSLCSTAVAKFFSASCVPCVDGKAYPNLCQLCKGTGENQCACSPQEPYFGYSGAFR